MKNFFTLTLCFLTLSLTAQVDCPNPYDGNGDGNVSIGDFLEMLAVFGDTDTDSDGVSVASDFYNSITFSILLTSSSNSFDLRPVSSTKVILKITF